MPTTYANPYRRLPALRRRYGTPYSPTTPAQDINSLGDTISGVIQQNQAREKQAKLDAIANSLSNRLAPPRAGNVESDDPALAAAGTPATGGVAGYQILRQFTNDQAGQEQRSAAAELNAKMKAMQMEKMRAGLNGDTAGITPYQRANLAMQQRRMDADAADRERKAAAAASRVDPSKGLNDWLKTNTGIGLSDMSQITGQRLVNDKGEGDENGGTFEFKVGDETRKVPAPIANEAIRRYNAYTAGIGGGGPAPAVPDGSAPANTGGANADDQAAAWAQANPDDPRAAAIRQRLGL